MSAGLDQVSLTGPMSLPRGWRSVTLEDIVSDHGVFVDGDWVESKDQDPAGDVRLIQLADVGDGEYRDRSERSLTSEKASDLGCTFLEPGDVLIARMPDPLGRACIFPGDRKRAVTVVDVAVVRPRNPELNTRWLMYCINAPQFRRAVASLQSGSTRQRISRRNLAKIVFPLPPLDWQDGTVAEIEKQFSRLDEAVANLKRVNANLKRYKASVLKAAVDGLLVPTEAELARRESRSYETGEQLLKRVLEARLTQSQGKGKHKEPTTPHTTNLHELPEGWVWVSFEQACFAVSDEGKKLPRSSYESSGVLPVIDQGEEEVGGYTSELALEFSGDLPVIAFGDHTRRFKLVRTRFVVGADGVKLIGIGPAWVPEFLWFQLQTLEFEDRGYSRHFQFVRNKPLMLPPLQEQHRIVAEVDRRLSLVREVEAEVESNLKRAQALRQAVLARAFSTQP